MFDFFTLLEVPFDFGGPLNWSIAVKIGHVVAAAGPTCWFLQSGTPGFGEGWHHKVFPAQKSVI